MGALPLAGYLVLHLLTQAVAFVGEDEYGVVARWIDDVPGVFALEIVCIYGPLLFHVGIGLLLFVGQPSPESTGWAGRRGSLVQQASGLVLLVFLIFHVWQFRGRTWAGQLDRADFYSELCANLSSTAWGHVPLVALGYLLGLAAAAAHAGQGVYHAGLAWGWVSSGRRQGFGRACGAGAIALFILGALTVVELATGSVGIGSSG
jgi:succinate dehydrogenase / fumarate reductase cytochrome b subunit